MSTNQAWEAVTGIAATIVAGLCGVVSCLFYCLVIAVAALVGLNMLACIFGG